MIIRTWYTTTRLSGYSRGFWVVRTAINSGPHMLTFFPVQVVPKLSPLILGNCSAVLLRSALCAAWLNLNLSRRERCDGSIK